tara:strand:- start:299 stop:520 length:222 start_codon:yes stop_codon:yes gene_type:complete
MELKDFKSFCIDMHQENLSEVRKFSNYKEVGKSYNEYVISNLNFLYKEYERQNTEQARTRLDELNIPGGVHSL